MEETTKKPGLWEVLSDKHDAAAAEAGLASMAELAGEHPNEAMSLEGLYQAGRKELGRAQLPKHTTEAERPEITWADDDPSGDERNHVGIPARERQRRHEEASLKWKEHLREVEAEMEREAREKANLPFKMAEQRLLARQAWEEGERAKAEAAEAEQDRLAKIAGEYTPTDGAEYQRAAQAHFTKHYAKEFRGIADADLDRAASEALTEYQKTNKGIIPTPAVMSRLTARKLGSKAKEAESEDTSLVEGIGGAGSRQSQPGIINKPDPNAVKPGDDMFSQLHAFQRGMGVRD